MTDVGLSETLAQLLLIPETRLPDYFFTSNFLESHASGTYPEALPAQPVGATLYNRLI
jgi:hypothetical protein